MGEVRHWFICKSRNSNVPLRDVPAEFCTFQPNICPFEGEWIKVVDAKFHEEIAKAYIEAVKERDRLKAIVDKFKVHGTDGCRKCETGRVTMFIANENCIECDPESYELSR
jgi:hypothetical protein